MSRLVLIACLVFSGCGSLLGNLRKDFDDEPYTDQETVGGLYPEGGYLDVPGGRVGHLDRRPATSNSYDDYRGDHRSWISQEKRDEYSRDQVRRSGSNPSFSDSPQFSPPVRRLYKNGLRATRDDFRDTAQNEGSLWASDGQTNYYFTKNKIRGLGDIVQIKVESPLLKDIGSEIKRSLSEEERDLEIQLAKESKKSSETKRTPASTSGATATAAATTPEADQPRAIAFEELDLTSAINMKEGEIMMAEIVDRFPNGNYKIMANKRIPYRGSHKWMSMTGVVRNSDLDESEQLTSGKLYEYRLKVLR
jgi:flagellar basal body L-ring protein FlgH